MDDYIKLLQSSTKSILFIAVPATFGLIMLREPIIALLFESGLFGKKSVSLVSNAILFHALGLTVIGLYRIYSPAFYALKDTKTPVIGAFISLITNIVLCATMPRLLGIGGIAFAASFAALANSIFLMYKLKKKVKGLNYGFIKQAAFFSIFASVIMSVCIYIMKSFFYTPFGGKIYLVLFIFSSISLSIICYFILAIVFKMEEVDILYQRFIKSLRKKI